MKSQEAGENVVLKKSLVNYGQKCAMQVSVPASSERIVPWALAGSPSRGDGHVISQPPHGSSVPCRSSQERQGGFAHPRFCVFFAFCLFIELMGVTLVNAIVQMPGV